MTHLVFREYWLIIRSCRLLGTEDLVWKVKPGDSRRWDHTGALIGQLREPWWPYGIASWPIYVHGKDCVDAFIAGFALSPFLSSWQSHSFSFSLFLSTESQPPGRATELIDCALQIDFEQKVSALARRLRTGGERDPSPVPSDAQAASLKSSSTL